MPIPQIHLPKKSPKEKPAEQAHDGVKMTLRGVDGTLRELSEKDLYLEVGGSRVLKFRVLVKTQFKNKQGEPVRDSLLKPGDQLAVQVNSDDPETALRVILSRAATPGERASASKPFDHASAKVPVEDDTKPAGTIEVETLPIGPGQLIDPHWVLRENVVTFVALHNAIVIDRARALGLCQPTY